MEEDFSDKVIKFTVGGVICRAGLNRKPSRGSVKIFTRKSWEGKQYSILRKKNKLICVYWSDLRNHYDQFDSNYMYGRM